MHIDSLDHLVLTVQDIAVSVTWYERTLGVRSSASNGRTAIFFGTQKINLHPAAAPIAPHADIPTPGSGDLCFLTSVPLPEVTAHFASCGVAVEVGPVDRSGALGTIRSLYIRDPDLNLIEISNLDSGTQRMAGSE